MKRRGARIHNDRLAGADQFGTGGANHLLFIQLHCVACRKEELIRLGAHRTGTAMRALDRTASFQDR
jgi:hypothetical protein